MATENSPSSIKANEIVTKALDQLAASPSINITQASAAQIKPELVKEMTAVVMNQTNQEPWYQSMVLVGAFVAMIGGLYGLGYDIAHGNWPTPAELPQAITPIIGSAIVIYGRLFNKKPIGA